jgi:hypothetical protein
MSWFLFQIETYPVPTSGLYAIMSKKIFTIHLNKIKTQKKRVFFIKSHEIIRSSISYSRFE